METYSSCCVQGSAGFWSSYRSPTDPERGGQLFGLSEVVYNWLQGGAGPSTLQPGRRLLLLRLLPGAERTGRCAS